MSKQKRRKTGNEQKEGVRAVSSHNDASWYANNPFLLNDAGSLSYNTALGTTINLGNGNGDYFAVDDNEESGQLGSVPGIMSILIAPSVGISTDNSSPINIAARNIYSYVRHANSGHANYDSPDLMLYLVAMSSLYSAYTFMLRAYGVLRVYSQRNRFLPKGLFRAMHLDFDDFQANIADFRYYINTCAQKIGSLVAPSSMSFFHRAAWMYGNVYKDEETDKSQVYLYTPAYFWQYDGFTDPKGGRLKPIAMNQYDVGTAMPLITFQSLRSKIDGMIAALIEDEDINIMSGDILKAFGAEAVVKLDGVPEDLLVVPVHDEEVLNQINNLVFVGHMDTGGQAIEQDATGAILFNPKFYSRGAGYQYDRILNMDKDEVSPGDNIVATRLTSIAKAGTEQVVDHDVGTKLTEFQLDSCGSEIALVGEIFFINRSGKIVSHSSMDSYGLGLSTYLYADLTKFRRHPLYGVLRHTWALNQGSLKNVLLVGFIGDLANYTIVGKNVLFKLHQTALLSMFSVPQMGAFDRKVK